jgi:hypothetical protein
MANSLTRCLTLPHALRKRRVRRIQAMPALCYALVKKAQQMQHTFHFVAVRRRMPAAQVLPSATRPRLFAGD